jgi:leader peptidase (prepilin peptidase)/N-methyltransferase
MLPDFDLRLVPLWVFHLLALIVGLAVGSFANVCIHRIPRRESVVTPPSRCPACGAVIRAFDNVPVLSWLWLGRRCRACRKAISVRYPLVEAANGVFYLGLALVGGPSIWTLVAMPFTTALLVLALIDLDVQLLPNVITLPGIASGIAVSFLLGRGLFPAWPVGPAEAVLSAAGGYLTLLLVSQAYEKIRGEPGLGQGDWKMAAFLGAFLGWEKMLLVVFLASLGGTAVACWLLAKQHWARLRVDLKTEAKPQLSLGKTKLPLGTFLSAAAILVLFGGEQLLNWYKGPFSRWIQGSFGA